ncbi:MAG: radical SAM protein [bacterium]
MKKTKNYFSQITNTTKSYGEIERKASAKNIPLYAHLELTYMCNLKCVHCYLAHSIQQEELSTDEMKHVIDQLAELGTLYLSLTGGEILCRNDFFEIAEYARAKNFALRLFTNATLITPDIARQIQKICPLFVEISLYGISPEVHDSITQVPGSHSRTIDAIHLLKEKGINLLIKTVVMRLNFAEVLAVKNFTNKMGAIFRADPVISPKLDGATEPLNLRIDDDELLGLFREINNDWKLNHPDPDSPLCNAGKSVLAINPNGEVFPCLRISNKAGAIKKQPLNHIWKSSEVMKKVRELTLTKLKSCVSCDDMMYCNPCPGLALLEHGELDTPAMESCRQAGIRKMVFIQ